MVLGVELLHSVERTSVLHIGTKGHCRHQYTIGNIVSTNEVKLPGFLVTNTLI